MNNKILLVIGGLLLLIGLVRPNINFPVNKPDVVDNIVVVTPPANADLRKSCESVIEAFKTNAPNRKKDAQRLSNLYIDLSSLIELDGENEVIRNTEEIRQANSLSGDMLRLNIKGLYPDLAEAAKNVIVSQIGDEIVPLDKDLRLKAVEAFRALSWACNEGSK